MLGVLALTVSAVALSSLIATDDADLLEGGKDADNIDGLGGDDTILGAGGVDILNGDAGNDFINGQSGADVLDGGADNDTILGGGGNDDISGGLGDDLIFPMDGDFQTANGDAGNDTLADSPLSYGTQLFGGEDSDRIFVRGSSANAEGGGGNDTISVTGDAEQIYGNAGNDRIVVQPGGAFYDIYGGEGNDTIVDNYGSWIEGNEGDDRIFANWGWANVYGGEGNDSIFFADDILNVAEGGPGDDLLVGGSEDDILEGGENADRIFGKDGNDELIADSRFQLEGSGETGAGDFIRGGKGEDTIIGSNFADTLKGGLGADAIRTFGGGDEVDGGFGRDVILGSEAMETLNGGNGDDTILGFTGADLIDGGQGDDVLLANGYEAAAFAIPIGFPGEESSAATLNGGNGDDEILFNSEDQANGGPGADVFAIEIEAAGETSTGIQDFDITEDQLVIVLPFGILAETSTVSVTNTGGTATVVVNDGATEVARVSFTPIGGDMTEELVTLVEATQVDYAAISSDLARLPN